MAQFEGHTEHVDGLWVSHVNPDSTVHVGEHPSAALMLPSSHSSILESSSNRLPQTLLFMHVLLMNVNPDLQLAH